MNNAVLIETGGLRALLTRTTLTIHDAHGGRVIVTGPDLETLVEVIRARGKGGVNEYRHPPEY
jgi:hypothetical protein